MGMRGGIRELLERGGIEELEMLFTMKSTH
jgi:hypothetical protein